MESCSELPLITYYRSFLYRAFRTLSSSYTSKNFWQDISTKCRNMSRHFNGDSIILFITSTSFYIFLYNSIIKFLLSQRFNTVTTLFSITLTIRNDWMNPGNKQTRYGLITNLFTCDYQQSLSWERISRV